MSLFQKFGLQFYILCFVAFHAAIRSEAQIRNARRWDEESTCRDLKSSMSQNLRLMEKSLERKMMMFSTYTQSKKNGDDIRMTLADMQKQMKALESEMVMMEKRVRMFGDEKTKTILDAMREYARDDSGRPEPIVRPGRTRPVQDTRPKPTPGTVVNVGQSACSAGYKWIGNGQAAKCVRFYKTPKTFREAQGVCRAEGSHVITIKSQAEMKSISAHLIYYNQDAKDNRGGIWIGLYNVKGQWMWVDGRQLAADWSNWEYSQPDGRGSNDWQGRSTNDTCAYMDLNSKYQMKWSDTSCDMRMHFVCQKRLQRRTIP